MEKRIKIIKIIKVIVFLVILLIVVNYIGGIFIPKWYDEMLNTAIVEDFYDLPRNSLDVFAVGSSQLIKGFSSLELYKNYGISSYGLGIEQQSVQNSYAWIRESLKYQNEKVVLFEVKMLFEDTPEAQNRKGFDNMKFSLNKLEVIIDDSIENKSYSRFVSFLFPITRFHSRWKELNGTDFTKERLNYINYRGYALTSEFSGNTTFSSLDNNSNEEAEITEIRLKYFNKIVDFCEKNNLELVLFKTQDMDWDSERYNAVKKLADENNLEYIDFNKSDLIEKLEFDYSKDCGADNHLNIYGAEKVSNYIGNYLSEKYDFEDKRENSEYSYLTEQLKQYNYVVENRKLVNIFDPADYMEALKNEDFTVIFVKNGLIPDYSQNFMNMIDTLGFSIEKVSNTNYCVIWENGEVKLEQYKEENLNIETTIMNDKKVEINTNGKISIMIDGLEYSNNHSGFDIVVCNNKNGEIIESSYLDFSDGIVSMGR